MEKWLRTKFPGNCFSIHRCDKQGFSPVWSVYKCLDLSAFMNQDEYLRMVDMNKTYGYKCFQILNPIWNFLCQKIECFHQTLYSLEMAFSIPIEIYNSYQFCISNTIQRYYWISPKLKSENKIINTTIVCCLWSHYKNVMHPFNR